jgi:hypothetical protein
MWRRIPNRRERRHERDAQKAQLARDVNDALRRRPRLRGVSLCERLRERLDIFRNRFFVRGVALGLLAYPWPSHKTRHQGEHEVYTVAFAPSGKYLATAGRDHVTRLWDVTTYKDQPILPGHEIEGLAFSPDGRTLALASQAKDLFWWDIKEQKVRRIQWGC